MDPYETRRPSQKEAISPRRPRTLPQRPFQRPEREFFQEDPEVNRGRPYEEMSRDFGHMKIGDREDLERYRSAFQRPNQLAREYREEANRHAFEQQAAAAPPRSRHSIASEPEDSREAREHFLVDRTLPPLPQRAPPYPNYDQCYNTTMEYQSSPNPIRRQPAGYITSPRQAPPTHQRDFGESIRRDQRNPAQKPKNRQATVSQDFESTAPHLLTAEEGDIVTIINSNRADLWFVHNDQGRRGHLPSEILMEWEESSRGGEPRVVQGFRGQSIPSLAPGAIGSRNHETPQTVPEIRNQRNLEVSQTVPGVLGSREREIQSCAQAGSRETDAANREAIIRALIDDQVYEEARAQPRLQSIAREPANLGPRTQAPDDIDEATRVMIMQAVAGQQAFKEVRERGGTEIRSERREDRPMAAPPSDLGHLSEQMILESLIVERDFEASRSRQPAFTVPSGPWDQSEMGPRNQIELDPRYLIELGPRSQTLAPRRVPAPRLVPKEFECPICFGTYPMAERATLGCSHFTCRECMRGHLLARIGDRQLTNFECPMSYCEHVSADTALIRRYLSPEEFERFDDLQLKEVAGQLPEIFYCPRPECGRLAQREAEVMAICACGFAFCIDCNQPYHGGDVCGLSLEERAQRIEQDREARTFIDEVYKKCPNCSVDVEKTYGCNHMYCGACFTHFCWICLDILPATDPYGHFRDKKNNCTQ